MWGPTTVREWFGFFWGMVKSVFQEYPVFYGDEMTLTPLEAVKEVKDILLAREGETVTPELAEERARNIVTALMHVENTWTQKGLTRFWIRCTHNYDQPKGQRQ